MSMKPGLALKAVEVVRDLEDQGVAEGDAFRERHADIRTVVIISSI